MHPFGKEELQLKIATRNENIRISTIYTKLPLACSEYILTTILRILTSTITFNKVFTSFMNGNKYHVQV